MFENCDLSIDEYYEIYGRGIRIAKEELICCECGDTIKIGDKYEKAVGKYEGCCWNTHITCMPCSRIWDDLFGGQRLHNGLSESIEGCYEEDFLTKPPEYAGDASDWDDEET